MLRPSIHCHTDSSAQRPLFESREIHERVDRSYGDYLTACRRPAWGPRRSPAEGFPSGQWVR
eukprot:scaffold412497_cov51-Prasinocladus_malaysianus.AAC.1